MESVKEIFLAVMILVGGGFSVVKIHNHVKQLAVEKVQKGLPKTSRFTEKLTGISQKRIQDGYLD